MVNITKLLDETAQFLNEKGFPNRESPGLLQPKFNYPYSPSAGHHVLDDIVISNPNPQKVISFSTVPDRSIRMYDIDKIGISRRHLSFFETIVFGYVGASEQLPKEEAVKNLYALFLHWGLEPKKLLVTTLGHVEIEEVKIEDGEENIFHNAWMELLGSEKVKRTSGRRNLFYSRHIGNPGGTGCELYYKIGNEFIEIGSQVHYKFKFTGGLERTRNAGILQGYGLERLLMALENRQRIGDIDLFRPVKQVMRDYLGKTEDKLTTTLYDESLTKIVDHLRAIAFITQDKEDKELTDSQKKIFKKFVKSMMSEIKYLGMYDNEIYGDLVDATIETYKERYPNLSMHKERILEVVS